MTMEDEKELINAEKARQLTAEGQSKALAFAIQDIEMRAANGFNEAVLFRASLSLPDINTLIGMGYSVGSFVHPFEQVKMYRVSW